MWMTPRRPKLEGEERETSRGRTWVGRDQMLVGLRAFGEGQVL